MIANTSEHKRRRWFRLGPGTIVALTAAIGIALAGRFTKPPSPPPDPNDGSIVFEADAHGHLRRVAAPTENEGALPRLWKPEPTLLLDHAATLKLDPQQRTKIDALNSDWVAEKTRLEQEISSASAGATASAMAMPGHNLSATQVTQNLKDYSRLSRQYDEGRSNYWMQSIAVLTAGQQENLAKIEQSFRRTK